MSTLALLSDSASHLGLANSFLWGNSFLFCGQKNGGQNLWLLLTRCQLYITSCDN